MTNNNYLLVIAIVLCAISNTKAQKLTFSYDAAANQTERKWVCVGCPLGRAMVEDVNNKLSDFNTNLQENSTLARKIKVSPNPTTEILNVMWRTPKDIFLTTLEVLDMAGNRVFSSKYHPEQADTQISFNRLSPGVYLLIGYYSDNKTESLKVVKL